MSDWSKVEEAASLVEQAKEYLASCEAMELCLPRIFCETIEHHLARWLVDHDAPAYAGEEV